MLTNLVEMCIASFTSKFVHIVHSKIHSNFASHNLTQIGRLSKTGQNMLQHSESDLAYEVSQSYLSYDNSQSHLAYDDRLFSSESLGSRHHHNYPNKLSSGKRFSAFVVVLLRFIR